MPAWTRWRANLPASAAGGGADGGRRQERRGEEPDDEADAAAGLGALAAEVVAGLLDVHLAVGVLDDERHAVGDDLAVAGELGVGVEVLLREVGDEVDGDQDVQLLVVTHGAPLSPPSQALAACAARACAACSWSACASSSLRCGATSKTTCLISPVKRERRLVGVAAVDDEAVVAADVHAGVAREAARHGVLHPPARDRLAVDEQRHLAAGRRLRRVGREDELDVDLAGRQRLLGRLGVLEHAEHRVGVLELPVLHEEREPAEMVGLGDDHALGAALGDDQVGADRVRVVVDPRDHPARDVLDVAAEDELRLLRDRRHHAEEGRQPAEQRQDVVALGLRPEELAELLAPSPDGRPRRSSTA